MSKRLLGSALTYVGANLFTSLIPLLLMPVMTRLLSPHDYGVVASFLAAATFLGIVVGLGVQGVVSVNYFRVSRPELAKLVSACLLILVASLVLACLLLLAFWPAAARYSGVPVGWLLLGSLYAAMQFIISLRLNVLQSENKTARYAWLQVGQSLASAALAICLIVYAGLAWQGRIIGAVVASLASSATSMFGFWREGLLVRTDSGHIRTATRFGVTLLPHVSGGILIGLTDQLMVAALLGTTQAGLFSVALSTAAMIKVGTIALNRAWAPWLYEKLPAMDIAGKQRLVRYTYLYFALLAAGAIVFGLLAPFALKLVVGKAFHASASMVMVLSLGYALGGMYFAVTNYVFHAGATARLGGITATAGIVNVATTYLLIQRFGLIGAGYGFVLSQLLLFLGTWRLAHKVSPMPWLQPFRT